MFCPVGIEAPAQAADMVAQNDAAMQWDDAVLPVAQHAADTQAGDAQAYIDAVAPAAQQAADAAATDAQAWIDTIAPVAQHTADAQRKGKGDIPPRYKWNVPNGTKLRRNVFRGNGFFSETRPKQAKSIYQVILSQNFQVA